MGERERGVRGGGDKEERERAKFDRPESHRHTESLKETMRKREREREQATDRLSESYKACQKEKTNLH